MTRKQKLTKEQTLAGAITMMILEPWTTNPYSLMPDAQTLLHYIGEFAAEASGVLRTEEDFFDFVVTRLAYLRAHKNGTTPGVEADQLNEEKPEFNDMNIEIESFFPPFEGFVSEVKEAEST
jgi:hypothetical protein